MVLFVSFPRMFWERCPKFFWNPDWTIETILVLLILLVVPGTSIPSKVPLHRSHIKHTATETKIERMKLPIKVVKLSVQV